MTSEQESLVGKYFRLDDKPFVVVGVGYDRELRANVARYPSCKYRVDPCFKKRCSKMAPEMARVPCSMRRTLSAYLCTFSTITLLLYSPKEPN